MPELHHPDMPGRTITVHDRAVRVHRLAGWIPADETAPAEPVAPEQEENLLDLEEGD